MSVYLLILLFAISQSNCDAGNKIDEKYISFEFSNDAPKLLIPVTLQDSIPAKLVLDTGIGGSPLLDSTLVSRHPSLAPGDMPSQECVSSSAWNPAYFIKCILYSDPELKILKLKQRFIVETIADNKENNYYTAGLRVGDEIISTNGILWKDLTPEQKETLYQGDYIRFKIIRDGKNMEIPVPVNKNAPIGY